MGPDPPGTRSITAAYGDHGSGPPRHDQVDLQYFYKSDETLLREWSISDFCGFVVLGSW